MGVFIVLGTHPFDGSVSYFPPIERAALGTPNAARKRVDIQLRGLGKPLLALLKRELELCQMPLGL